MSKRCIRPLVAADVALSSRLPAPGAGAGNAAIRTGDRMVPPAAHSESRLRAAVLRFAPADGRYALSRLTTGVCPLPLGQGGATGSASPASGLPFCASAAAFRGSDCIRRSALRRITASGHDPPEYARIRFPERRSEKRHPFRLRRGAMCAVSVDDRRLPASARTGGEGLRLACLRAAVLRFGCCLSRFGAGQRLLPDRAPPRSPAPRRREDNE